MRVIEYKTSYDSDPEPLRMILLSLRRAAWSILLFAAALPCAASCGTRSPQLETGFRQMYNLNFAPAHQTFRNYQQANPADPFGHVANAAAFLFSEFDRLHILESDLFVDNQKFENRNKLTPDPALKGEFESELARGDELAAKALAVDPNDRNAQFSQIMSDGLRGDYAALIEKRNLAALSYMKTGRMLAQKLLSSDPTCYDAYLAIGVENYLLSENAAPVRWMLRITGAQTDRDEGLQRLRTTAEKGVYLAPFARLLLAVAALRNRDRQTARNLLASLATEFPGNQLYAQELKRIQ
jgi:hypothetical protein